ncbi:uncharacterized protein LOC116253965 isoform X1 [Nymphaea colorata]|nr:uncharacterized protein LOC116253965 isoform X1 [Nymphaea colorata]XP_031484832.1 uncharacterized protein LOC116253965 isoform X1 [Nymphaea colorata]
MAHNESVEDCKTIAGQSSESLSNSTEYNMQVTTFTEDLKDVTLHFQIIQLPRQIYVWIGCNSSKLGHLYAAAPTRPRNEVTVASILGGAADNTGLSISRRLVIKTGLNIVLACNIPKNCPMIEADAERLLLQKLKSLGYIKPNSGSVAS